MAGINLEDALADLIQQVESLDSYVLTRDLPEHEAQSAFDEALDRAKRALAALSF